MTRGKLVVVLLLIATGIGVALGLRPSGSRLIPFSGGKAATIAKLTQDLTRLAAESDKKEELRQVARTRKQQLELILDDTPDQFIQVATLGDKRTSFDASVIEFIEEKKQVQNAPITVWYIDSEDGKNDSLVYTAKVENSHVTIKSDALNTYNVTPGNSYVITGNIVGFGDTFAVHQDAVKEVPNSTLSQIRDISGAQKALVIPVNFSNSTAEPPFTQQQLSSFFFGSSDSFSDYYSKNSYGKVSFSGSVLPWQTLRSANPFHTCNDYGSQLSGFQNSVEQIITSQGISPSEYNFFITVINSYPNVDVGKCPGVAAIGGNWSHNIVIDYHNSVNIRNILFHGSTHEVGHNLGLYHAGLVVCNNKPIDELSKCSLVEYGDLTDTMGGAVAADPPTYFNAWSKLRMNWITPVNITSSGEYTVRSVTKEQQGVVGKIDLGEVPSGIANLNLLYYLISYRQPIGYDSIFNTSVLGRTKIADGVSIHLVTSANSGTSELLDLHAEGNVVATGAQVNVGDASLFDGETFYDPIRKVKITQVSHDSESAKFKVELDATSGGDSNPPDSTPTATPTTTTTPGSGNSPTLTPTPSPKPAGSTPGTPAVSCPANKNTQFWWGCTGEPKLGCGGTAPAAYGWQGGSALTSEKPAAPFDLDINCFANLGASFPDARIELDGPGGRILTLDTWQARDITITQAGNYIARCIHKQNPSCSDTDQFSVAASQTGGTSTPPVAAACPAQKDTQFWFGCSSEPYVGCGGLAGWISGTDVTNASPKAPFDLDINCFADYGSKGFSAARIELDGPDGRMLTLEDWQLRNFMITKAGTYTARCVHKLTPSCSDTDQFTVGK